MSFLIGLLYVIEVIVCLLLALAVMLQKPKEGGLGGAIGGGMSEAVFGADASNVLIKVTIWLGSIFLVNTLLLARLTSVRHSGSVMDGADKQQQQPQQQQNQPVEQPAQLEEEKDAPEAVPANVPTNTPVTVRKPVVAPVAQKPAATPVAKPAAAPVAKPAAAPVVKPAAAPVAKPAAATPTK